MVETSKSVERQDASVRCAHCGADMLEADLPRMSRGFGLAILFLGMISFVMASVLFGLPIVLIGLYMSFSTRSVWACSACGAVVDRNET